MKFRPIKDGRQEAAMFARRAVIGFLIIFVLLGVLGVRFWYLQVSQHDEFQARSDANRILTRPLAPARGLIYDRNGVLLAENVAAFRLEVIPEQVADMDALLHDLQDTIGVSDDDIARFKSLVKSKRSYQSVPLRLKLSEEEIALFSVNRWRFSGVDVVPYLTRFYPKGAGFGHLVGYVGRIDAADVERLDASLYAGTTHAGKTGIERSYEALLHGQPGYELVEVNADRRPLRVIDRVAPTPGKNLYLTVDARIQEAGEAAFEGRAGASVAIDPRNGEVLAMISVPSFDPNLFVNGISQADYKALLDNPDKPLLDRALRGSYVPGSTVKPFLAAAGLELGLRTPSDTILSTGEFFIPGQTRGYRDVRAGGHGRVDLVQSLAQSVNAYYYSLAHRAWREGEPVFPSLDYYYDDAEAKGAGDIKMVGSELLSVGVAGAGATEARLYLPAGNWYDWRAQSVFISSGEYLTRPLYADDLLQLPLFARDGGIVPMADGVLRVFGSAANSFDWYDDDGISTAYQRGAYDHLAIAVDGGRLTVTREQGDLAPRTLVWTRATPITEVRIDGNAVPFSQERSTVAVALPPFDSNLVVEVR